MVTEKEIEQLIEIAKQTREFAFVPQSDHKVGACVLTNDGEYFGGCNIQGVIEGLGVCAERAAVDHMVVHGKYRIKAIAVYDEELNYPCGSCLQYLMQFYQVDDTDITIIVADKNGKRETTTLLTMLPRGYLNKTGDKIIKTYR